MNEIVIINKKEIESMWEKDHLCFIKMKSGKVWLCTEYIKLDNAPDEWAMKTKEYILKNSNGLVMVYLAQKGKSE